MSEYISKEKVLEILKNGDSIDSQIDDINALPAAKVDVPPEETEGIRKKKRLEKVVPVTFKFYDSKDTGSPAETAAVFLPLGLADYDAYEAAEDNEERLRILKKVLFQEALAFIRTAVGYAMYKRRGFCYTVRTFLIDREYDTPETAFCDCHIPAVIDVPFGRTLISGYVPVSVTVESKWFLAAMNLWNGTYPEQIPGQQVALYDINTLSGNLKSDQKELDAAEIVRITAVTPDAADCYRFGFEGGLYLNRHIQRKTRGDDHENL